MTETRIGCVIVRSEGVVVRATIDRVDRKNAIDLAVLDGLEAALELADAGETRVFVVRGSGQTFSSGADLSLLRELDGNEQALREFMNRIGRICARFEAAPYVIVTIVEGFALAGGCELLLAGDVSVAAANAVIGDRHAHYGLVPAAGGSIRLAEALPRALATYLLLSGDVIDGARAAELGLVSFAVPPTELEDQAARVVDMLAQRSPDSLRSVKRMLSERRRLARSDALEYELDLFLAHMRRSDAPREGLNAFHERRVPRFRPQLSAAAGAPDGIPPAALSASGAKPGPEATE